MRTIPERFSSAKNFFKLIFQYKNGLKELYWILAGPARNKTKWFLKNNRCV